MEWVWIGLTMGLLAGLGLGLWIAGIKSSKRLLKLQGEKNELESKMRELSMEIQSQQRLFEEKEKLFREAQEKLEDSFRSLSAKALEESNRSFLTLAQTQFEKFQEVAQKDLKSRQDRIQDLVNPVRESLQRVDQKIQEIEQTRASSEASIIQHMNSLVQTHRELRSETSSLVAALRAPQSRGRWGELQLKRVVEMAGMLEHCDFQTQVSESTQDGRLRPDLIVNLPGGKQVVVDAKTPLASFMDAVQSPDLDLKSQKLREHAKHIRKHIDDLSKKSYWSQFRSSPEFVVLFLPGEAFFSAALEHDPGLIEAGVSQNVIIATPTTLIALLRSVAYGWQQEKLTENVRQVAELGQELYKRISDMAGHFHRLGRNIQQTVECYNKTLGSLESRVLVSARKMNEMQIVGQLQSLPDNRGVDESVRSLSAPELQS